MYNINEIQDFKYITFPSFEEYDDIFHCFTTRAGGVSEGSFASMNIGFSTGDNDENVKRNIEIMAERLNLNVDDIVETHQTHTNNIMYVTEEHKGRIFTEGIENNIKNIDGIYTDKTNLTLMSFHADCTPVFLYDPIKKVIGLAHAGWRGTVQNIGGVMVKAFINDFNSDPKDIKAAIGPSLCKECFEVDEDVKDLFVATDESFMDFMDTKGIKYYFNLWEINKYLLLKEGLRGENIEISGICTKCRNDLLFSHRGQGGKRGLMTGLLMMKKLPPL
ncbi:peptidoglycan editing factor PgeF [Sedimentibacter hydroxybenzoicus DSM 7310]|uniref:Purine nucleoside phosphorylase n=1 Tax=Sedimentibacter hydroxybenzoicus DSM 7310 TaxID=1123245 RepID=A0A974GX75_SEDHY|nr:peptidoglycan editing factor PgeF [Sedimentibacter hydroxybenzoicus]NYB74785.1 peptidoglycan editing factor PgeF [Sedimentibacter hydroxybenzoicus DSM 7310]